MFRAHVEATVEIAHANGPETHKCHEMHGHSMLIEIDWQYGEDDLDDYGWGPDFGRAKGLINALDHRNLNDLLSFPPSAENIATYLYHQFETMFGHYPFLTVTVHEGRGNRITRWHDKRETP